MLLELEQLTEDQYHDILKSGMFWEYFPHATGNYYEDVVNKNPVNEQLLQEGDNE